jgi:type IV secretory pathway VirD2 relaxase
MIAKGRFVKGGAANSASAAGHLNSHLKYLEHRSRDDLERLEDRSIYSREDDDVERRAAVNDVMEHTSHSVSYHKIVLSPGDDEPVQNWRAWTREVMADLEDEQGKDLHWYAVVHQNTDHPHVHVVVAGAGEDHETGLEEAVKLYQEDYRQLRESGHEHSEYEFYYQLETALEELERQDDVVLDLERELNNDFSPAFDIEGGHER